MGREEKNQSTEEGRAAVGFRKTGCIIILAFVIVLLATIFADCVFFPIEPDVKHPIWEGVRALLINIASAGITIGAGTVLYGHFDFVQYVKSTLCKVIIEHDFTDHLNDKEKEKLMQKLQKHLIYHDKVGGNDTLFDFVNDEVRSLIQEPYYEELSANISCGLIDGKIIKNVVRKIVLNYQQDPTWKFDLGKSTKCHFYGEIKKDKPPYKLKMLRINGKPVEQSNYHCIQEEAYDEQGYGFTTKYVFEEEYDDQWIYASEKKTIAIELEYETEVDISDKTLGFRTNYPCRKMEVIFTYEDNALKVYPDIFCFKDRDANGRMNRDRIQMIENKNCIQILFQDWLLPGDGIIYFIESVGSETGLENKEQEEK